MKENINSCPDVVGNAISIGDQVLFCPSGDWRFGEGNIEWITKEIWEGRELYQVGIKTIHGQRTSKSNQAVIKPHVIPN